MGRDVRGGRNMSEAVMPYGRRSDDRIVGLEADLRVVRELLNQHLQQERDQAVQVTELAGSVAALVKSVERIEQRDADQQRDLRVLNEVLSQARGGWRTLLGVGVIIGTLVTCIAWALDHLSLFGGSK
ncbi:hypothetical protein [Plasticicumulans sp.]|uniref:hypothetical protein n=1 Tax=Plasticicumulans sp. TaxID=2307179 RepID=UPI00392A9ED9